MLLRERDRLLVRPRPDVSPHRYMYTQHVPRATRLTCHVSRLRAAPGDPARADHGPAQLHLLPLRDDLQLPAGLPGQPDCHALSPAQSMPRVQVVGGATRICQADGTWTRGDLPTCIPVQCDIPHNPVNGEYKHFILRVYRAR